MKLILSRKGFDSSAGGCPSPVFPDGSFYALPIPDKKSRITYQELSYQGVNIGKLVADLTGDPRRFAHYAHLDPDLIPDVYPRATDWRPLLGQSGSAQGHLRKQEVGVGDVFLFFGLFRRVEKCGEGWRFIKSAPPFHALWGWLQIGQIHKVDQLAEEELAWARYHPHFHGQLDASNTLYLASETLRLGGMDIGLPGAGTFRQMHDRYRLTAPGISSPTLWRLPGFFYPNSSGFTLSFHSNLSRWSKAGEYCHLMSASRGQEFVLETAAYPETVSWLNGLVRR